MTGIEATAAWPSVFALLVSLVMAAGVGVASSRQGAEAAELRARLAAVLPNGERLDPKESAYSVLVSTLERLNEENRTLAQRLDDFRVSMWTWQQSADSWERQAGKLKEEVEAIRRESATAVQAAQARESAALAKASGLEEELAAEREARKRLEVEVEKLRGEVEKLRGEVERKP